MITILAGLTCLMMTFTAGWLWRDTNGGIGR